MSEAGETYFEDGEENFLAEATASACFSPLLLARWGKVGNLVVELGIRRVKSFSPLVPS